MKPLVSKLLDVITLNFNTIYLDYDEYDRLYINYYLAVNYKYDKTIN